MCYNEHAWDRPILLVIAVIRYNREDLNTEEPINLRYNREFGITVIVLTELDLMIKLLFLLMNRKH